MKINYKNKICNDHLYLGNKINSNYFEGWYFKHVSKNKKYSLSFIIGISKSNKEEVFIQGECKIWEMYCHILFT